MADLTPQSEAPTPTTDKITQAARETIYLCNFRVSVDGEWLCLRELNDISLTPDPEPAHEGRCTPCWAAQAEPSTKMPHQRLCKSAWKCGFLVFFGSWFECFFSFGFAATGSSLFII